MKINKNEVLKAFSTYDTRTQDMLEIVLKETKKQGKELSEYSLVIFQLLAIQFEIYYKAYDSLDKNIVDEIDLHGGKLTKTKPQLDALQKANTQISKLLKDLGLSPLEQAKIRKLNSKDDEDSDKAFDELYA